MTTHPPDAPPHHPVSYGQSPRSSIMDFARQPVLVYISIEQPCQYTELNSELGIESSEPEEEDHGLTRHIAVAAKQKQNCSRETSALGSDWCSAWREAGDHLSIRPIGFGFLHTGIHVPSVDLNLPRPIHLDFSFQSHLTDHLSAL